jgi:hypothetical protein
MTSDLLLYGIAVALLFGLAGFALERIAAWRGVSRRGIWVATLILSVAFPTMRLLAPHRPAPPPVNSFFRSVPWSEQHRIIAVPRIRAQDERASVAVVESGWQQRLRWSSQASLENVLRPLWLTASLGMVTFYALLSLRLRMAARRWRREWISGQEVWVTETLGPAVYGFIRPIILMPQWVLDGPDATRSVVLVHEQEHIVARDPRLLMLGLLLVAIAPWNLPLWWQLRRLRFAIEVDCDARVLGRGAEARAYGEVLLSIGQQRGFTPIGAIALTEPASQLLRRIQIMTAHLPKRSAWFIGTVAGLSLACIAVAAELQAPTLSAAPAPFSERSLLKPPVVEDPRQANVQELVRATYPELFSASAPPGPVLVTLLLNKDGTLYKSYVESIIPGQTIRVSEKAFAAMGVDVDKRGVGVWVRMPSSPATKSYVDVRAWYMGTTANPNADPHPPAPNDDPAIDRAIAERYFPDLYTYPKEWPRADAWVLLNRQGQVLKTGRRVANSGWDVKLYVESLYPGIKIAEMQAVTVHGGDDQYGDVIFAWLAKDSPLTDPSAADLSRRQDLAIFADIARDGVSSPSNLLVLNYGSTGTVVSAHENPYGVVHLQITAQKGDGNTVELHVRLQHAPLGIGQPPSGGPTPAVSVPESEPQDTVESVWPSDTPGVRVPFGGSGTVQLQDQNRHNWSVVLYAERLNGA